MKTLSRSSAIVAFLLASPAFAGGLEPAAAAADELAELDGVVAQADDEDDDEEQTPLPPEAANYRNLNRAAYDQLLYSTGFDADALAACGEETDVRIRERSVTRRVPFTLYVLPDGGLRAEYTGEEAEDDDEATIAECVGDAMADMELNDAPEELRESKYRYIWYDANFYPRRRTRHAEIISLYTLSGVSAAVGVGAFIAARNDEADAEERLAAVVDGEDMTVAQTNASERPDRFRAAGFAMVGVSVASFVGATLLQTANRNIERRENPVLVFSPGSPTGDLGFTLSSQF